MRKGGTTQARKPLKMLKAAREELCAFPIGPRSAAAYALRLAEEGGKHPAAKPMKGFGGASVLEHVFDDDGDTYRTVYTVQFPEFIVLLHAFEKKSKSGKKTPKKNLELIDARLKAAKQLYGGSNEK